MLIVTCIMNLKEMQNTFLKCIYKKNSEHANNLRVV